MTTILKFFETVELKIKFYLIFLISVKPETPVITLNQTVLPLREGHYLQLICSTNGGNPPPGIRWLRNNDVITEGGVMTLPSDIFGVTSSSLTRRLERADHRANYSCTAENEANIGLPVMNSLLLEVQCECFYQFTFSIYRIVLNCSPRGQDQFLRGSHN